MREALGLRPVWVYITSATNATVAVYCLFWIYSFCFDANIVIVKNELNVGTINCLFYLKKDGTECSCFELFCSIVGQCDTCVSKPYSHCTMCMKLNTQDIPWVIINTTSDTSPVCTTSKSCPFFVKSAHQCTWPNTDVPV